MAPRSARHRRLADRRALLPAHGHHQFRRGSRKGLGPLRRGCQTDRVLDECSALLERYGGTARPAGLDVRRELLEEFKRRFLSEVSALSAGAPWAMIRPARPRPGEARGRRGAGAGDDLQVTLTEAEDAIRIWLRHLEPFGFGNPRPVLLARDVRFETWPEWAPTDPTSGLPSSARRAGDFRRSASGWATEPPNCGRAAGRSPSSWLKTTGGADAVSRLACWTPRHLKLRHRRRRARRPRDPCPPGGRSSARRPIECGRPGSARSALDSRGRPCSTCSPGRAPWGSRRYREERPGSISWRRTAG